MSRWKDEEQWAIANIKRLRAEFERQAEPYFGILRQAREMQSPQFTMPASQFQNPLNPPKKTEDI